MISALDVAAHNFTHGKGQGAMAAPVFKRHGGPIFGSEQDDRLIQQGARQWLVPDFIVKGGDVPGISQEHGLVLQS